MIKGFMAKSFIKDPDPFDIDGSLHIYNKKGKKIQWYEDDWPPIPVTVLTAEEVDKLVELIKMVAIKRILEGEK